jgi:hypothetical protein
MATTTIQEIYNKAPAASAGDDDILLIAQNEATKGVKLKNVTTRQSINAEYAAHLGTKAAPLKVGTRGVPIYIDKNGVPQPCDNIQAMIAKDTIVQSTDVGAVDFDRIIIISATNEIILTIGDGEYIGLEVKIINTTDKTHIVRGTTARDEDSTLLAGQIQTIIWNGSKWEGLSCPRIGEVYVQYPQQEAPQDLFICTKWTLQEQYAGAFFRATGGNAAAFIEKTGELTAQKEGLPNITGYDTLGWHGEHIGIVNNGGDNAGAFIAGEIRDGSYGGDSRGGGNVNRGVKFDASHSNPIYGNSEHVTPENYTAKLWRRTA